MSRPPREWIAGGTYHVFSRGSNKQAVFAYDSDRIDLLECAGHVVERHNLDCLAFGLMPNHCHWLFRIPADDNRLSIAMKELNGRYSLRFNRRYAREAHLFRNRFGAVRQDTHEQLLWTARYIARNPVEADLCSDPSELPWTSYRATAGLDTPPDWLAVSALLSYFGNTTDEAVKRYVAFVAGPTATTGV
jgi:REP element-mobilizing transposase RayT